MAILIRAPFLPATPPDDFLSLSLNEQVLVTIEGGLEAVRSPLSDGELESEPCWAMDGVTPSFIPRNLTRFLDFRSPALAASSVAPPPSNSG